MTSRRGPRRSPAFHDAEDRDPEAMRKRQLGYAVKNGRKVTFDVFDAEQVCGYIAGWDDTSWFILEPIEHGFRKRIVNKDCNPLITLHDEATYEGESAFAEMEPIVAAFREAVLRDVFKHTRPATRKAG